MTAVPVWVVPGRKRRAPGQVTLGGGKGPGAVAGGPP